MRIVGLTGGIASGKSTVGRLFAALGAVVHSADEDARQVLADGSPVLAEVLAAFPDVRRPDGTLDRARLGARIFADPSARIRLEAIMHPAIIARMRRGIDEAAARRASSGPGVLVYETPLLYEAGLETLFDVVVAVLATPEQQRERLQARERAAGRDPLSASELAARLTAQLSPQEKARRADHVIRTDGPLEETEAQVRQLWNELVHSSQA
jgi:dephospho-CoA kinase